MSRQLKWALLLLVGAVAIAALLIAIRPEVEEKELEAVSPLVETARYEVQSGPIAILGSGTVQPREEVTLGAEVSGKLTYVNPSFREGQWIGRGALLFRVDQAAYANSVRIASADVAAQDVAVLQAREEAAIAEAELAQYAQRQQARNRAGQPTSSSDYAARILPPETMARPGGGAPAGSAAPGAQPPNRLATREPQLRSARANRERAAAQLADARLNLSRTQVRAPFSGIVRSESAALGTLVQPGQALGSIVATDFFEVRMSLSEGEARLLPALFAAGNSSIPAQVTLDYGDLSYSWPAVVDRVDPILDPETRTINVFLRVPNPMQPGTPVLPAGESDASQSPAAAPPLLLGSFVRASITGVSPQPYATIPLDALRTDDSVWLLQQGKLKIVPVTVIQRSDDQAFVSGEGLGKGGHVIISGLRAPVDGMPLRNSSTQGPAQGDAGE